MISSKELLSLFTQTRQHTEDICFPLKTEDYVVQPVIYVSPPKWHLGHTTWFFEEFLLKKYQKDYTIFDNQFSYVFNSYYESVGDRVLRPDRGNMSRPTVQHIFEYRKHVTVALKNFLETSNIPEDAKKIIELGCHHEKQHQELLLTDIKFILGHNPLLPEYETNFKESSITENQQKWISLEPGIYEIGHKEKEEFCYDNELGRHKVYLQEFRISNTLTTNREYLEFIQDNVYHNPLLWHSEGWEWIKTNKINAPMYWYGIEGEWHQYTLGGLKKLNPDFPVTHISYYEAFAFAQWKNKRLPTEFEWEAAKEEFKWGDRWEWTESAHSPYPGYKKDAGALGEYNGKFMVNQKVLRGGSVASATQHIRSTYRNFFHPHLQWQFTGIRLAE